MLILTKLHLNFIKAFLVYLILTEVTFFGQTAVFLKLKYSFLSYIFYLSFKVLLWHYIFIFWCLSFFDTFKPCIYQLSRFLKFYTFLDIKKTTLHSLQRLFLTFYYYSSSDDAKKLFISSIFSSTSANSSSAKLISFSSTFSSPGEAMP